ncbi:MAG: superoxide dismutase [Cellulosilyticaceae bacterium]
MAQTVTLPALPYAYNALEPFIDEETMHIHHDKHFQTYVDKYNAIISSNSDISNESLCHLLMSPDNIPASVRQNVINQGGGVYNHDFFFKNLSATSSKEPTGNLKAALIRDFGSIEDFKAQFSSVANMTFGSGWAWLVKDGNGKLSIISTANQDTPISRGLLPLMTVDVWEHAYYLKYQNRRPEYTAAFWNVVNWDRAEQLFNGEVAASCL